MLCYHFKILTRDANQNIYDVISNYFTHLLLRYDIVHRAYYTCQEIPNLKPSVEYLKRHLLNHLAFFFFFFLEQITDRQIDILFYNLWQEVADKFTKLSKIGFFYRLFYSWLFATFYRKTSKLGFWVDGWVLAIKSKHFRDFLNFLVS